jgi:murein DD-endopeptidase MepM/ murein hydrolase activator NlpD
VRRRLSAALVILLLLATVPAWAQTGDDLKEAERQLTELRGRADELTARIELVWHEQIRLEEERALVDVLVAESRVMVSRAEEQLDRSAIEMYILGASSTGLLAGLRVEDVDAGLEYVELVSADGEESLHALRVARTELDRQASELLRLEAEHEAAVVEMKKLADQLQVELAKAQVAYDALIKRRADQARAAELARLTTSTTTSTTLPPSTIAPVPTTIAPSTTILVPTTTAPTTLTTTAPTTTTTTLPAVPAGQVCPVAGAVSFTDSWGDPRSGGRTHQGVDMMAALGTPAVAVESGKIRQMSFSTLGGITLWLQGINGDDFYYAHLDGYASGLAAGQSVVVGQVIGFVGSSGNAPDWLPHLHFELHPGGGTAANPYPLVKTLCG